MFITFEGIEGSGKSTQRDQLTQYLQQRGVSFIETREPGGTLLGVRLRQILLEETTPIAAHQTELFLFAADRIEHIHQVIQPALDRNEWVICDRYIDSTYAYQHGGRQHSKDNVINIIRMTEAIEPDITFFLDVSVEEGLKRATSRGKLDRFEREPIDFHHRIRDAYLARCREYPHRMVRIDAESRSIGAIFHDVLDTIKQRSDTL